MLQIEHVSCGYGGKPVVQDISFEVNEGEKLCILGPNGSGKTTLLKGLAGILPVQGCVRVCGEDLSGMNARQRARRVALMSQLAASPFAYTVYETVLLGRYAHQKPGAFHSESDGDREIVRESLERVGMFALKDRLVTELSGGQLQRVYLARIFAQDPLVVLLDEPTNHLDLKYQMELVAAMREWVQKEKRCVVGVLHDINLALSFGDRVLLMDQGKVLACESSGKFDLSLLDQIYHMNVGQYMREALEHWRRE